MSRPASIASPDNKINQNSLHPTLQVALGSLNIQLDEELARYRRRRRAQGTVPGQSAPFRQPGKPLDLMSLNTPPSATPQPPASRTTPAAEPSSPSVRATRQGNSPSNSSQPQPTPQVPVRTEPVTVASPAVQVDRHENRPYPSEPIPGLVLSSTATEGTDVADTLSPLPAKIAAPLSSSDDPYSYFESSEELLRSLSEDESHAPPKQPRKRFNPLGVGSVLLLLLTSASLGYVLMNTIKSQQQLGLNRAKAPTAPTSLPQPKAPVPTSLPNSPDLTAKEFVDLNLNTLGTLPSDSPKPSPALAVPLASPQPYGLTKNVSASPTAALKSQAAADAAKKAAASPKQPTASTALPTVAPVRGIEPPPSVVVPVTPIEPVRPAPVRSAPVQAIPPRPIPVSPKPAKRTQRPRSRPVESRQPAAPKPVSAPAPAPASAPTTASPQYRVVVPFSGDQSLEQVKQYVQDARVMNSNEGAKIQAGAFQNESNARQRVQELKEQGIEAQIVPR